MKLLDRLILKDLIPKLLMSIALGASLFLVAGPVIAAFRFLSQGVPLWVVVTFVGWNFTAFISLTFPLGMLVASLLGFERLSRESESVALFAGGISFPRIILPVLGLGLVVSLIGYEFNDRIASYANQRVADFKDHRQDALGETTKPFDFANRKDDKLQVTVHVERGYDVQAKAMRQVTITLYDASGRPSQIFYADRAKSHGNGFRDWTLLNGTINNLGLTGGSAQFASLNTNDIAKTPENIAFLQRDPETLNFQQLQQQINELKAGGSAGAEVRNAEVGLWFKTSLPFSCLIFGLVGAPLGMRPPRSAKVSGAIWAVPIMLGYYVIYMSMSSIARGGGCPPLLAAWLPNVLGLFVGAGLIWKASK